MSRRLNPTWLLEPLERFPTSLGAAAAAALIAALRWSPDVEPWLLGLAAIFAWGVAIRLTLEARVRTPRLVQLLLPWAAVLLLPLPQWVGPPFAGAWLVPLSGALAVIAAPLASRGAVPLEARATWARAVLWAAVQALALVLLLAGGLSLLLSGTEALFTLGLSPGWLRWIWIPGLLLVLPWLALALLPRLRPGTPIFGLPRWLLMLLDWLLAPLVLAFGALLNAYALFILVRGEMPKGVIAPMVVAFALVGGALWCLTFGRRREGIASRLLRRSLLPALAAPAAALLVATWQRIEQYGLTEPRYLLLMLGALLLGTAAYQLLSRRTPGPATVALPAAMLALAASCGPWGATALSVRSAVGVNDHALRRDSSFSLQQPLGTPLRVAGFDTMVSRVLQAGKPQLVESPAGALRLELSASGRAVYVSRDGALLWRFDLGPLLAPGAPRTGSDLLLDATAPDGTRLRLRVMWALGERLPGADPVLRDANLDLLLTDLPK